mgnify:CR=1 FL=1
MGKNRNINRGYKFELHQIKKLLIKRNEEYFEKKKHQNCEKQKHICILPPKFT